jgi:CRISPR/Cas system-associated exonuclease Cas4 (RecB family)
MKKEKYELSSQYMKDLKKLLKAKKGEITFYRIAHDSFRKNYAHWIIDEHCKKTLVVTYLNGDRKKFSSYNELMNEIKTVDIEYKKARKKYVKRYHDVIKRFTEHRKKMRNRLRARKNTKNTIANTITPEQVKLLASQY